MTYQFSRDPKKVGLINTQHRTVYTGIPCPGTREVLEILDENESQSMHGQIPIVWDKAQNFNVYDICGNNELIVNGKTGYLVENKNSRMLASQICNLIEKKYLRDKMAEESELRIKKYFSLEDCAVNHIKTFNSLITKKAF